MITPNAEHSMSTNLENVLASASAFIRSIAAGKTREERPSYSYTYDNLTGEIVVTVPPGGAQPMSVHLRHGQTMQDLRRDFRWVRLANNRTQPCTFPFIPLPDGKELFGGNCLQLILWRNVELKESAPGVYRASPPEPTPGFWTGYFVSLFFEADTPSDVHFLPNKYEFTTPGYTWPNALPFPECFGDECLNVVV